MTPPPSSPKRVALIVETSKHYGREVLRGIARFQNYAEPWSIFIEERALDDPEPTWLDRWDGDGIITRNEDKATSRRAAERGIAVVNLRYVPEEDPLPSVFSSEDQISALAAEHFAERGFVNFAYCGLRAHWAEKRSETFEREVGARGAELWGFPLDQQGGRSWEREQRALVEWIESLPKPVAILAANDPRGLQLLDACRRLGADVPREVAVLGVDNDPELCALSHPPLSSIDQGVEAIGYRAAEMLDRMMRGDVPEEVIVHCRGAQVFARQSTETLAIDDAAVRSALMYIVEKVSAPIGVADVVAASGVSRRALEIRFRERIGSTIRQQIQVQKLALLKRLLTDTKLTLDEIAERAGYAYTEHMVTMFRREVGETPGRFRKQAPR